MRKGIFYAREDVMVSPQKKKIYKVLFGIGFLGGALFFFMGIPTPFHSFHLTLFLVGAWLLLSNGYFLLCIKTLEKGRSNEDKGIDKGVSNGR